MTSVPVAGRAPLSPLGLAFLVVASTGWGLNFPIMKFLLTEWPPLSSRGLCGVVGAAGLALVAVARGQRLCVPDGMWLRLALVSTLSIGGWVASMGLALIWLRASEAAVLGISIPVWVALVAWPVLGERVHAVIVTRAEVNAESLRAWCAERLSDYKVPETVALTAEPLPRNANGKVIKRQLREGLSVS